MVSSIEQGLCVLVGIQREDTAEDVAYRHVDPSNSIIYGSYNIRECRSAEECLQPTCQHMSANEIVQECLTPLLSNRSPMHAFADALLLLMQGGRF